MSKRESRSDLKYLDQKGFALTATSIIDSEVEDDIVAVTSDDRLVNIYNCSRLHVGAAGTGEGTRARETVEFTELLPPQEGLYRTIEAGAQFINEELKRRKENGKAFKQWEQTAWMTLAIISEDPDEYAEAKEDGIEDYLTSF